MKHLLLALVCAAATLLSSCINNPYVTVVAPDGTKTTYSTGRNLMGEVDEQVSEVQGPGGIHIRHMVKRQDATRVPIAIAQTVGTAFAGWTAASVQKAMEISKQLAAGEITKQEAQKSLERIALAESANKGAAVDTVVKAGAPLNPVTVNPP